MWSILQANVILTVLELPCRGTQSIISHTVPNSQHATESQSYPCYLASVPCLCKTKKVLLGLADCISFGSQHLIHTPSSHSLIVWNQIELAFWLQYSNKSNKQLTTYFLWFVIEWWTLLIFLSIKDSPWIGRCGRSPLPVIDQPQASRNTGLHAAAAPKRS